MIVFFTKKKSGRFDENCLLKREDFPHKKEELDFNKEEEEEICSALFCSVVGPLVIF